MGDAMTDSVANTSISGITHSPLSPPGNSEGSCMLCASNGSDTSITLCKPCALLSDSDIIAKYRTGFTGSLVGSPITQSHADCVISTIMLRCQTQSQNNKNFLAGINGTFSRDLFASGSKIRTEIKKLFVANLSQFQRIVLASRTPQDLIVTVEELWSEDQKAEASKYKATTLPLAISSPVQEQKDNFIVYMAAENKNLLHSCNSHLPETSLPSYAYKVVAILKFQLSSRDDTSAASSPNTVAAEGAGVNYLKTLKHSANNKLNNLFNRLVNSFCELNKLPSLRKQSKAKPSPTGSASTMTAPALSTPTAPSATRLVATASAFLQSPLGFEDGSETDGPNGCDSELKAINGATDVMAAENGAEDTKTKHAPRRTHAHESMHLSVGQYTVLSLAPSQSFTRAEVDKYNRPQDVFRLPLEPFVNKALGEAQSPPIDILLPEAFTHLAVYNEHDVSCLVRRCPPSEPAPTHIFCIIGSANAYSGLFLSLALQAKVLSKVRSLALLKPVEDFKTAASFAKYVFAALGGDDSWQGPVTVLPVQYGDDTPRQIVVFFRTTEASVSPVDPLEGVERGRRMAIAYRSAQIHFQNVPNGSHSVGLITARSLIDIMRIGLGDVVWDIGCGMPCLAAIISAVTHNKVVCTDVDDVFNAISLAQEALMNGRDRPTSSALLHALRDVSVPKYTTKAVLKLLKRDQPPPPLRQSLSDIIAELTQTGVAVGYSADNIIVPAPAGSIRVATRSTANLKQDLDNDDDSSYAAYRVGFNGNGKHQQHPASPDFSGSDDDQRETAFCRRVIKSPHSTTPPVRHRTLHVKDDASDEVDEGIDTLNDHQLEHDGAELNPIGYEERGSDTEGHSIHLHEPAQRNNNEHLPPDTKSTAPARLHAREKTLKQKKDFDASAASGTAGESSSSSNQQRKKPRN